MFRNTIQVGFLSILNSSGSQPLQIWKNKLPNGHARRRFDNDIMSPVLELVSPTYSSTYITCPSDPEETLGIELACLVLIVKNLKKYFTFEVEILDHTNVRRHFRASTYQSTPFLMEFMCVLPLGNEDGWKHIHLDLKDLTKRFFGTNYVEALRVQIYASCRICRVYFSDKLYTVDELPEEYQYNLHLPNHPGM